MPPLSASDAVHLQRALALAHEAQAFASPNPTVGCVLTNPSGALIGEGAHFYDRRDHAEITALKAAAASGHSVQGATAYVTLEPCTVHGRTGPCADALIAAGIARCVIATADPNPAVHGNGVAKLRAAGVETLLLDPTDPLAIEARRLNDAFAFSITHGRPFVRLKAALSVDGKLAPAQHSVGPHWLTGEAARADVQQLRHTHDAILTGIGTVLADNPLLTDRTGRPRHRPLLRVVLDRHLRTPLASGLVLSVQEDVFIVCSKDAPTRNEADLVAAGVEVLRLGPGSVPLAAVLRELDARGIRSVLVEAGAMLNAAFLDQDLVDQVILYFAESELGPDAIPFAANGLSPFELQQRLTFVTRATFPHGKGEDIRIAGYLHDPWV
jgi:diaminohydroxyphosphoribosylaminopyrimidine deaminase/5-amino-6-(5-phosphoribosylamino)uracil reductase